MPDVLPHTLSRTLARTLTPQSTLETLRREAKRWHKAVLSGDAQALSRFRQSYPGEGEAVRLREVQQALAREHGFASWAELKQELEDRARTMMETVDLFLEKSVNRYGTNPATGKWGNYEADTAARGTVAARLLSRHPEIARVSIHTAVAAHDIEAVRHFIALDPSLANDRSPFDGWTPLLRLAYARLPLEALALRALDIATILIDAGADPNAGWSDSVSEFNVMVGVIGDGENRPAPHPRAKEFARLLIDRGADPFAPQALYNTSIGDDSIFWLEYLWKESENRGETIKWTGPAPQCLGGEKSVSALAYLLGNAVPHHPRRMQWLLEHGADANGIHFYSREPVLKHALYAGSSEAAEMLLRYGATPIALQGEELFLAKVASGDIAAIRSLAEAHPAYLGSCAAMFIAIRDDRIDLVAELLDLGMSPDIGDDKDMRALHFAVQSNAIKVAQLLIARGAEIDPVEQRYNATPLRHASYLGKPELVELIAPHSHSLRALCFSGFVERVRSLLAEDTQGVKRLEQAGENLLFCLPDDENKAVEIVEVLLAFGASPRETNAQGQTPGQAARRRGLDEAADLMESDTADPP